LLGADDVGGEDEVIVQEAGFEGRDVLAGPGGVLGQEVSAKGAEALVDAPLERVEVEGVVRVGLLAEVGGS
jgi:hypothetical protein